MRIIPVGHGKFTKVDDDMYDNFAKHAWRILGGKKKNKYVARRDDYVGTILMHRVVVGAKKGEIVDHIDNDGFNNQRSNLRICTHAENMHNSRIHKNNKSGYKGVSITTWGNKYRATIIFNKKSIYIGSYLTPREAAIAYDKKAVELFGKFANLNIANEISQ